MDCDNGGTTHAPPTFHGDYDTVDQHRSKFGSSTPQLTPLQEATTEVTAAVMKPVTETPQNENHCQGNYDAVALLRGELFVFKGKVYKTSFTQKLYLDVLYSVMIM